MIDKKMRYWVSKQSPQYCNRHEEMNVAIRYVCNIDMQIGFVVHRKDMKLMMSKITNVFGLKQISARLTFHVTVCRLCNEVIGD